MYIAIVLFYTWAIYLWLSKTKQNRVRRLGRFSWV